MRKLILISFLLIIIGISAVYFVLNSRERSQEKDSYKIQSNYEYTNMKLESSVFENNGAIPSKYTCDGENINPPLAISEVPEGVKSLVLIMDDPDVPKSIRSDGVWDHWLVWNIPLETAEIPEGREPQGVIGKNTGGKLGYQGPCPPDREHRYFFKLYALDTMLNLPAETTKKGDLEKAMEGHIVGQAELMGRYARK